MKNYILCNNLCIKEIIQIEIKAGNITLSQIASKSKISYSTLWRIMNNEISPTLNVMIRILDTLGYYSYIRKLE